MTPTPSGRPPVHVVVGAAAAAALGAAVRLSPSPVRRPSAEALALPGRRLVAADGVALSARHDAHDGGGHEVGFVVAHGFTGSWRRPDSRRVVSGLTRHGGVVSFDLRGHGRSGGACTAGDAEVLDLDAATAWARALGYRRIVVVGFSLGAAVALRQAALALADAGQGGMRAPTHAPDVVVAVSGPGRWYYQGTPAMRRVHHGLNTSLGRAVLRFGFGTRVSGRAWDVDPLPPAGAVAALAARGLPVLLVHGDADHYFPVDHAQGLRDAALAAGARPDDVPLWVEPGMGHAEGAVDAELIERMAAWALGRVAVGPVAVGPVAVGPVNGVAPRDAGGLPFSRTGT